VLLSAIPYHVNLCPSRKSLASSISLAYVVMIFGGITSQDLFFQIETPVSLVCSLCYFLSVSEIKKKEKVNEKDFIALHKLSLAEPLVRLQRE
jgi:hypothetical protein